MIPFKKKIQNLNIDSGTGHIPLGFLTYYLLIPELYFKHCIIIFISHWTFIEDQAWLILGENNSRYILKYTYKMTTHVYIYVYIYVYIHIYHTIYVFFVKMLEYVTYALNRKKYLMVTIAVYNGSHVDR
jgi:hypothetical protein